MIAGGPPCEEGVLHGDPMQPLRHYRGNASKWQLTADWLVGQAAVFTTPLPLGCGEAS
jgi:hypothetical protein